MRDADVQPTIIANSERESCEKYLSSPHAYSSTPSIFETRIFLNNNLVRDYSYSSSTYKICSSLRDFWFDVVIVIMATC